MYRLYLINLLLLIANAQALALPQETPRFSLDALINGNDTHMPSPDQISSAKTFISNLINDGKQVASPSADGIKLTVPDPTPGAPLQTPQPAKRELPKLVEIAHRAIKFRADNGTTNFNLSTPTTTTKEPLQAQGYQFVPASNSSVFRPLPTAQSEPVPSHPPYPWTETVSDSLARRHHRAGNDAPIQRS